MLFYTCFLTLLNTLAFIFSISTLIERFKQANAGYIIEVIIITAAVILNTVILVTIFLFTKFHLELVFSNQTTLETLELKRQGKNP